MIKTEMQAWLAGRKEAGAAIDIETCELGRWSAYDSDPYNIGLPLTEEKQIGTNRFARFANKRRLGVGGRSAARAREMYERINRAASDPRAA